MVRVGRMPCLVLCGFACSLIAWPVAAQQPRDGGTASGTDTPLPPQPAVTEVEDPTAPPQPLVITTADGEPRGMQPGSPAAFWIWRDPQGTWHVRTTTQRRPHEFRGRIWPASGALSAITPSRAEFRDRLRVGPRGVTFAFATNGHIDGFDFRAPEGCVRFNLKLDAGQRPARVLIGARRRPPPAPTFSLCPQDTVTGQLPVADPLPTQPAFEEPPEPPAPATGTPAAPQELKPLSIADGRPRGLAPGAPAAYWIWRDATGLWHLRTTTARLEHTFRGRVVGASAPVGGVSPSRSEFRDRIRVTPRGVVFSFVTRGHIDGFDFRPADNQCVRFNLDMGGGPRPKRIYIGARRRSPRTGVFNICP